jgi:hypothetical protein
MTAIGFHVLENVRAACFAVDRGAIHAAPQARRYRESDYAEGADLGRLRPILKTAPRLDSNRNRCIGRYGLTVGIRHLHDGRGPEAAVK